MGFRKHRDERLGPEHLDAELALADRRSQESQVERAVDESRDLGRGQQLASEIEHHAGQLLAQSSGERGKHLVGRGAGEADREAPVLASRGAASVIDRSVDRCQDLAASLEEHLAGG